MPGHGGEYSGKQDPSGLAVPVWPRPLRNIRHRIRARNLSGDATGSTPADPTKSFWHGGERTETDARAAAEVARQEIDKAIEEQWY